MGYSRLDYWRECLECACDECGATLTKEQIEYIADAIDGGSDNIGQAFYTPENPLVSEVYRLSQELTKERNLVYCRECDGTGRIIYHGPYHSSNTCCWKCNGNGKY